MTVKTKRAVKCYYCGGVIEQERDLVEKKIPLAVKGGTRFYRRKFHVNCVSEYMDNRDQEKETKAENSDWDKCYEYFKELLEIKESQKLDQHAVLRVLGLRLGEYVPNGQNVRGLKRGYTFETILYTMKFSAKDIKLAFGTMAFKNQKHKIDYAMKIVTNNINFIDGKMNQKAKTEQKLDNTNIVIKDTSDLPTYSKKAELSEEAVEVQSVLKQFENDIKEKDEVDELEGLFI